MDYTAIIEELRRQADRLDGRVNPGPPAITGLQYIRHLEGVQVRVMLALRKMAEDLERGC